MKGYNCIIWGYGKDYETYINAVRLQEIYGNIKVIGITAFQGLEIKRLDGYRFIYKEELTTTNFDYLIVASVSKFLEIRKQVIELGIDEGKILAIKIFALPDLDLEKYISIKNSKISIFANCCWGGLTYNKLGMEFYSPFINMFESCDEYLQFLEKPREYMEAPVEFVKYAPTLNRVYPVCNLNGMYLHFNHYNSYIQALELWNKRKERINWDNLFIMMQTEDKREADKFLSLPYERKICFVPFKTEEKDLFYVDYHKFVWGRCLSGK